MKISFKWPNSDQGKEFYIRTNGITGVREVKVDEIDATKIESGVYSFYDKDRDCNRRIEIINEMLDNPRVLIDDKEIELFQKTPMWVKFMMFLPFLAYISAGGYFGVITGAIGFIACLRLNHSLKSTIQKIIVFLMISAIVVIGTYYLKNLWIENGWFGYTTSSSSVSS